MYSVIAVCVVSFAALASLGYEKTCVLFNVAALASQIASEQNLDNDEGLKIAAKYYQVSMYGFTLEMKRMLSSWRRGVTRLLWCRMH